MHADWASVTRSDSVSLPNPPESVIEPCVGRMVDILAVAAHPDDVELNISGTLMKHAEAGRSFAICDLTGGERGTRGSAKLRKEETENANRIIGITGSHRWNLGMPDGDIQLTK